MANMTAASVTYEQHVQRNNERLNTIKNSLLDVASFAVAARELLEWCSDVRAFQQAFEENLIACLKVVNEVSRKEGYDLELSYRLLSSCANNSRNRLSSQYQVLIERWNEELGQELLHRHSAAKPSVMDHMQQHGTMHQDSLMWSGGAQIPPRSQNAVSVVTTVYPGTVHSGYQQYDQGQSNPMSVGTYPGHAPSGAHPSAGQAYAQQKYPQQMAVPQYAGSAPGPQSGYTRVPHPHMHHAAQVAAAAVATATATAVALDHSQLQQQQHPQQYPVQQMPMNYPSQMNGSQHYGASPAPQYGANYPTGGGMPMARGSQQGIMAAYPSNQPRSRPMMVNGGYPQQMAATAGSRTGVAPPPQYPGTKAQHPNATVLPGTHPRMVQPSYPYGAPRAAAPMQQSRIVQMQQMQRAQYPGVPQGYSQQQMRPSMPQNGVYPQAAMVQGNRPNTAYPYPVDVKPQIRQPAEERITFPINNGTLLAPFRLEHGVQTTRNDFVIKPEFFEQLKNSPDMEVQLKCFHHEDRGFTNNWPQDPTIMDSNQITVDVAVNGHHIPIERTNQALYIKNLCQTNTNSLQISVRQCCCSHLFLLQIVNRPLLNTVVRKILQQQPCDKNKTLEKIMRANGTSSAEIQQTSCTLSLNCPISQNIMSIPGRGCNCAHIECFDLVNFLSLNQDKKAWLCPICQRPITLEQLEVDQYITEILQKAGPNRVDKVVIDCNGAWRPKTEIKQEARSSSVDPCYQPMAKRAKMEPGTYNPPPYSWNQQGVQQPASVGAMPTVGSPQQPFTNGSNVSVLSPNGFAQTSPAAAAIQMGQRSQSTPRPHNGRPLTPGRVYGPPTPVTPPSTNNPPSVGQMYPTTGPRSVGDPATGLLVQQGSVENNSLTGSAPYTPASVGSAGSNNGQMGVQGSMGAQSEVKQETMNDLNDLFGDGSAQDNLSLLSDAELLKYLEPSDLAASSDFGTLPTSSSASSYLSTASYQAVQDGLTSVSSSSYDPYSASASSMMQQNGSSSSTSTSGASLAKSATNPALNSSNDETDSILSQFLDC